MQISLHCFFLPSGKRKSHSFGLFTIAVTCTLGFLRMVFRGNRDGSSPFHSSQGSPKRLEFFLPVLCCFYFFFYIHSSPWILCLERKGFHLQNLLPVNSSIPEHFGDRCNDLSVIIKVK